MLSSGNLPACKEFCFTTHTEASVSSSRARCIQVWRLMQKAKLAGRCSAVSAGFSLKQDAPRSRRLGFTDPEEALPSEEDLARDRESRECAVALAKVAWDIKAEDICVLHVAPLIYWTSYMVVLTVKSRPQMQAVIAKIEALAAEKWGRRISEYALTARKGTWEVLDFQDVVVQIFTPDQRDFYDLEGFYGAAEEVDLPFLLEEQGAIQWSSSV